MFQSSELIHFQRVYFQFFHSHFLWCDNTPWCLAGCFSVYAPTNICSLPLSFVRRTCTSNCTTSTTYLLSYTGWFPVFQNIANAFNFFVLLFLFYEACVCLTVGSADFVRYAIEHVLLSSDWQLFSLCIY